MPQLRTKFWRTAKRTKVDRRMYFDEKVFWSVYPIGALGDMRVGLREGRSGGDRRTWGRKWEGFFGSRLKSGVGGRDGSGKRAGDVRRRAGGSGACKGSEG